MIGLVGNYKKFISQKNKGLPEAESMIMICGQGWLLAALSS